MLMGVRKVFIHLNVLLLICCPAFVAKAETLYSIQLEASRQPNMAKFDRIRHYGTLYIEDAGRGLKRVKIGYYYSRFEAKRVLNSIRREGFNDAFIAPTTSSARNRNSAGADGGAETRPIWKWLFN